MKLTFGPDEVEAFAATKAALIAEFRPWADEHYGTDDESLVADAETFLSWRFNYSTGDLADYGLHDVEEFLLGWVPAKFAVGPDEAPILCRSMQAFTEWMALTGRLRGGVDRAARIMTEVDGMVDEVAAALADESNFGISKSMLSLDLTGPDGSPLPDLDALMQSGESIEDLQVLLDERMEAFNSLPFEQRRAMTDPMFEARAPKPIELPFLFVPPSPSEVDASIERSELCRQVDAFVRHLGETGMKLTQSGNLRLADARELVTLLDTGDEMDPELWGRTHKTRMSLELRWLTLIDQVATVAGATVRLKTKLKADPNWFEQPPVVRAQRVLDTLLSIGPLGSEPFEQGEVYELLAVLLDSGVAHWFAPLLPAGADAEFSDIADLAKTVTAASYPQWRARFGAEWMDDVVAERLAGSFEILRRAGLIDWTDRVAVVNRFGTRTHWEDGLVSLTALGRQVMVDYVGRNGFVVNSIGDVADVDAMVLVNAVATQSLDADEALTRWRADATTSERAHALAEAAMNAQHPAQRLTAFELLGMLMPAADVGPPLRQLLDTPCAGHAASLLLQRELATPDEVGAFVSVGPLVDMLYTVIDSPVVLDELFRGVQARSIDDLLDDMWRCDQPETLELLEALGRYVTDKKLAKSARKAAIKHRSWLANQAR